MPEVSVIMPAYNCANYIERALESVLAQNGCRLEVIIVNDGSTDDTEKVLERYLNDSRIRYNKTAHRGVSHALNIGLKSAASAYIAFLHADDVYLPGKIKKQFSLMEKYRNYDVSYTNESYFLDGCEESAESPYFHFSNDIFYFIKRNNFIHISTTMFRRDIFKIAVFDEKLKTHEDWDFFLKLSRRRVRFKYMAEALSRIRIHHKSLSSDGAVMDETRAEVGLRAKRLWRTFKTDINLYSIRGIINFTRYIAFKVYAFFIGFPNGARFNRQIPYLRQEMRPL